jgi:hypothetical protein
MRGGGEREVRVGERGGRGVTSFSLLVFKIFICYIKRLLKIKHQKLK